MIDSYYHYLTRTDHPVFNKDYENIPNSKSFNSILNYILAEQLLKLKQEVQSLYEGQFPHLVGEDDIDDWEENYFGFVKTAKALEVRINELLEWINNDIRMSLPDVVKASRAIVGEGPEVIVNANKGGFTLGKNRLGQTTILAGQDNPVNRDTYIVRFNVNIPSSLKERLDEELTKIEKAGSKHIISYPPIKWVLGRSQLGKDTILR